MKLSILLVPFFLIVFSITAQTDFITRWQLPAGQTTISFNLLLTSGGANYTWETIPSGQSGSGNFPNAGYAANTISGLPSGSTIRLSIEPTKLDAFIIQGGIDRQALRDVEQWGTATWTNMNGSFSGCENLNITANDVPNLSQCSDLSWMFRACSNLNGPANINTWNVSTITNMERMFELATQFNQPIGDWNTASVTNMAHMFSNANAFNQSIGAWNTINVVSMTNMFSAASSFNQPINSWNTSNVTNMAGMFNAASSYNQSLSNWNTANVSNMNMMFGNTNSFNQDLGNWNTANVSNFNSMFYNSIQFNQPIGNWDTGNATDMFGMFWGATAFNQSIENWDLSNVSTIGNMFSSATNFNQPLTNWNTSNVTTMSGTFLNATSFSQDIGNWDYSSALNMSNMFDYSGIDCETYNGILTKWAINNSFPNSLTIGVKNLYYSDNSSSSRNQLISQNSLTLNGDVYAGVTCATAGMFVQSLSNLQVFPNPAKSMLIVTSKEKMTVKITNNAGSILSELSLEGETSIYLDNYASGLYFIQTQEGQAVKFIKE